MKNKIKVLGFIALAAIIGFSMTTFLTGCGDGSGTTDVPVTGVSLNQSSISLTVGGSETLTATVAPKNATNKAVTWSTSNETKATVAANGKVTAVAVGTAIITVTTKDGRQTDACTVTVSDGSGNQTPAAADFTVSGSSHIFDGNPKTVSITPKQGKSGGTITIYYNGAPTAPSAIGSYTVTFDVAAATGWNAATGLSAGTMKISEQTANSQTPTAADFEIGNLSQTAGSVTAVTIAPKAGKSEGQITIYYNGAATIPQTAGTYTVTFDIAAALGWNAVTGLSAGTLEIAARTVTSIEITANPKRTTYNLNEDLDTTGMVVTATFNDNSTQEVTGYDISGYDKLRTGNQIITVSYGGKTDTFTVNVILLSLPTVTAPTASPSAGTYFTAQNVTLSTTTSGAAIRYTTDGTEPTTSSTLYSGAISISETTTIKAFAVKDGMNNSTILEAVYTVPSSITQLTENTWADGNLPTSSDEQWFKFSATAGTQYIHISFGTLTYMRVQVYDSSGNTVGRETELYSGIRSVSRTVMVGQDYYIKVRPFTSSDSGTYRITFNTTLNPPGTVITPLTENTWADGNIPTSSDEQWFNFTATAGTQYIHISFGTLSALYVQVYDSSGTAVRSETYFSSSNNISISRTLTIGRDYYIRVRPLSSYSGTYRIAFNTTHNPPGTTTTTLTENTWADGNLPTSSDEQWFNFTATAGTQYIHICFGTLTYMRVQVYDSSGAAVGSVSYLSDTRSVSRSVTEGQEYYIRVWTYSSYSGTYRIAFNTTFAPPGTTTLTENTWADGNLPTSSDEQWFKFSATAETQCIHGGFGTLTSMRVQVYDSSGVAVGSETWLSSNTRFVSRSVTAGQEYYIRVWSSSSYSGTYQIAFNALPAPPGTAITMLTENTWADGNIPTSSDEQWFKFTATAETQCIHVSFGTLQYLYVQVYDSSGATVGSQTNLSSSNNVFRTVMVGQEYYIRVRPYNSSYSGTYRIGFNATPCPPGTTITTLTEENTWANGNIPTSSDEWFKFIATAETQYIHVSFGTLSALYVWVYDSNGNTVGSELSSMLSSTNNRYASRTLTVGQEYYIWVLPYSSSYSGTYRIAFNESVSSPQLWGR
jgi:hypothetical protein